MSGFFYSNMRQPFKHSISQKPYIFLLIYLLIGWFTIRDYGIPSDDFTQYVIGQQNYDAIVGDKKLLDLNPEIKFYGPVFETLCYAIDRSFPPEPPTWQKWGMRHGLIVFIFTCALGAFWFMLFNFFNTKTAWGGTMLLAYYPRIFADAHYNSKDTLFLSLIVFFLYHLYHFTISNKYKNAILAGLWLGIAATLRLSAFFAIPSILISILMLRKNNLAWKGFFLLFIAFILAFYAFFPALWQHPLQEFATLVNRINHFPWPNQTLIAGRLAGPIDIPFWYFPLWFFITTPLFYFILFIVGLFSTNKALFNKPFAWIVFLFFGISFSYIILFRPNLYDAWRQLQYMMVLFVFIGCFGIYRISLTKTTIANITLTIFFVYPICICLFLHPFQYVYFNEYYCAFNKSNTYDQDYWSISNASCMKWLDKNKTKRTIHIYTKNSNMSWLGTFFYQPTNHRFFSPEIDSAKADYEIESIRNNKPFNPKRKVVYSIIPLKDTIARIIQLK